MIVLLADILFFDAQRKVPIFSGYKPAFDFIPDMKTSGKIELLGQDKLQPGSRCKALLKFPSDRYLGNNLSEGTRFTFGEPPYILGEGTVLEIVERINEW